MLCLRYHEFEFQYDMTPLMQAASREHAKVVEMLIAKGAKVNAKNKVRVSHAPLPVH